MEKLPWLIAHPPSGSLGEEALPAMGSTAEEAAAAAVQLLKRKGSPLTHREQDGQKEALEIHRERSLPSSNLPLVTAQTRRCVKRRGGGEEIRLSGAGQGVRGSLKCDKAAGCPERWGMTPAGSPEVLVLCSSGFLLAVSVAVQE